MPSRTSKFVSSGARPWLVALSFMLVLAVATAAIEPDVQTLGRPSSGGRIGSDEKAGGEGQLALAGSSGGRSSLRPYRGLGTWVDIYDEALWRDPEGTVERMKEVGVQTLYIETANYRIRRAIFKPKKMSRFVEAAHRKNIVVVAWYLPSFKSLKRDIKRSRAALNFRTESGQRFDRFALDIEATVVGDIDRRNRRMFKLTKRIRNMAGNMALGAIVPDPIGSLYWPNFPYAKVANRYDVLLPMGYFTYRVSGTRNVRRHVRSGIRALRRMTSADNRIHYIGGLAEAAPKREVRAYALTLKRHKVMGGGLYDFATTSARKWDALKRLRKLR